MANYTTGIWLFIKNKMKWSNSNSLNDTIRDINWVGMIVVFHADIIGIKKKRCHGCQCMLEMMEQNISKSKNEEG